MPPSASFGPCLPACSTIPPAGRPDKGLDGRRFKVTVTGYRRQMFWLQDLDSNEVVGPLVPTQRVKAPTGNRAKARRGRAL